MQRKKLGISGFTYKDLFTQDGLQKLDNEFVLYLKQSDEVLYSQLLDYRSKADPIAGGSLSTSLLVLSCAPILEAFVAELFEIKEETRQARESTLSHDVIISFKKTFVLRRARRRLLKKEAIETFDELDRWLDQALAEHTIDDPDQERAVSLLGELLLSDQDNNKDQIELLTRWCIRAMTTPEGQTRVSDWVCFQLPQGLDYASLVPVQELAGDKFNRLQAQPDNYRLRDGFKLTDTRMNARQIQNEVNYCVYCHKNEGDYCSKGFHEKKGEPEKGFKKNPLDVTLTGCPLGEKISEMQALKRDGHAIAALATIMIDNPMCPSTGHRICNDCMKGCIYQKQEPVNIPEIETRCLTDVLSLPWGVEIYDLLTRWNPLRQKQWLPKPYNGLNVLITGMGPSGFTLAHHLLMEGFAVVGTDGLKIEPLPRTLIDNPVEHYSDIEDQLDERIMTGFGGVTEYGITVRWDKNFLKLIYLTLMRRPYFQVFGAVRFGGTIRVEDAWELGFDHVAIAVGAGLPQALPVPGSLAPGMRQANDFLMALQLSGAAKASSLANLQIRLPAVVIGGGLTGIDTATEVQAYYIQQVEKLLYRFEKLVETIGKDAIYQQLDEVSRLILEEQLAHGNLVKEERQRASSKKEEPDFISLIRSWGGVTVAYRRNMNESPAYRSNHEEVRKALEEGIYYAAGIEPLEVKVDQFGHCESLLCVVREKDKDGNWYNTDKKFDLPARGIFAATGARPNVAYSFEHPKRFLKENGHYQTFNLENNKLISTPTAEHIKKDNFGAFTSYEDQDSKLNHRVTFIGDTHPVFNGNVVKAVASGMRVYPEIVASFGQLASQQGNEETYQAFSKKIAWLFTATIDDVIRHNPTTLELRIQAPMAARRFKPGQFFRLQNYESSAPVIGDTTLQTETMALTGALVDKEKGLVSLMIMEKGTSSRICATLKKGDPVSLMGPSGVRMRIPDNRENILIVGDTLCIPHILGVGPAMLEAANKVCFILHLDSADELFCQQQLEQSATNIVWNVKKGELIKSSRPHDISTCGDLLDVVNQFSDGSLPGDINNTFAAKDIDRIIIVGNQELVRSLRDIYESKLMNTMPKVGLNVTASISTPMQCMLKGVCSQCLQWQIDPQTGKRTKAVFSCSWQDQPLHMVDLDNWKDRLGQNRLQEGISNLWLDHLFKLQEIEKI
ncbi:MAG: FAD-dependent oxidoreductase [Gammaproteobacteria bacterium]|nr:MAG: FAD-dependent oxidoreductase [Gammaproteobacteria bacterium]